MSNYSQEYIERIFDLIDDAVIELSPSNLRIFLEKSLDEIESRLFDLNNYSDDGEEYSD